MSDRRTLGPSTAHNRQSTASFGRQSCFGKRPVRSGKDPRDLHSKSKQKETKQKVIAFLAEHQYPADISVKTLMNQKEFFAVVWFMLSIIQAEVSLPPADRTVDALIHHLKALEYPYVPPKSTLQSCSSPLFLPAMLGLLEWLLDSAQMVADTMKEKMKSMSEAGVPWCGNAPVSVILQGQEDRLDSRIQATERGSRFFSGFMHYLRGDDDEGSHVVQLVEQANELRAQHAETERERQRRVIEDLDRCRNELLQQPDLVAGKLRELEALRQRQRTAGEAISSSRVELTSWNQQAADAERKERKLQLDIEETERERLLVKKRIANQPMDLQQAMRIRDNLRREKREASKKQQQLEEYQKENTGLKDEAYDRLSAVEKGCTQLNDGLYVLKMCPSDAKYAGGADFSIQVPRTMKEEACERQLDTVLHVGAGIKTLRPELDARLNVLQNHGDRYERLAETKRGQVAEHAAVISEEKLETEALQAAAAAEQAAEDEAAARHQQELAEEAMKAADMKAEEFSKYVEDLQVQLEKKMALEREHSQKVISAGEKMLSKTAVLNQVAAEVRNVQEQMDRILQREK